MRKYLPNELLLQLQCAEGKFICWINLVDDISGLLNFFDVCCPFRIHMFLLLALLIEKAGNVNCSLALDERTLCGLCFDTK